MLPIKDDNAKGFWEEHEIYSFNRALLARIGTDWDKLAPIDANILTGPDFLRERQIAIKILSKKLSDNNVFAFKDPRTTILTSFWRQVCKELGLDDQYIITLRNPLDSALSLNKRNNMVLQHGILLWAKYMFNAVTHTQGKNRIFVSYDQMLEKPDVELRRIANAFNLVIPPQYEDELDDYRNEFLDFGMRNNQVEKKDLKNSELAPGFILKFYTALCKLATKTDNYEAGLEKSLIDKIAYQLNEYKSMFILADELRDQNAKMKIDFDSMEKK